MASAVPAMARMATEVSASTKAVTTTSGWQTSRSSAESSSEPADHENRWREHRAIQCVQRGDFSLLGFGGILGRVALLADNHLVALILFLMAFINA